MVSGLGACMHTQSFLSSVTFLESLTCRLLVFVCRCTFPRPNIHTAKYARNTGISRLLNTRRARTRSRPRVRAAIAPNSPASVVRPSLYSERRPSRPRRSPSGSSAPWPRSGACFSSVDARHSFSERTHRRTSPVPSSESSNASGKALANRYRDELCGIGRVTSSLQLFSQQFLFFIIYIAIALSYRLCAI